MYDKGQLVLNTLRDVINNDPLWFSILKGLQEKFAYKTVDADDITNYIKQRTATNYDYFFDQYLRYPDLPEFTAVVTKKGNETVLRYKWKADVSEFHMPIRVTLSKDHFAFVHPTEHWQTIRLKNLDPRDFKVDEDRFFCEVSVLRFYIDPNSDIKLP